MEKNMKRTALFLAIFMLIGALLVGCTPVPESPAATDEPVAEATTPAEEEDTATVEPTAAASAYGFEAADALDWSQKVPVRYFANRNIPTEKSIVTTTLEEKFNFDIQMEGVEDAGVTEKLRLLLASGDMPDVFTTWWTLDVINEGTARFGAEAFQTYMPDMYQYMSEFAIQNGFTPESIWTRNSVDGVMVQFPRVWDGGQFPSLLLARKDMLVDLGFANTPTTVDEWDQIFAAYKAKYPEQFPWSGAGGFLWQSFTMMTNAYGWRYWGWDLRDGKIIQGSVQPEYADMFVKLADWYNKGYIQPDWVQNDNNARLATFTNGQAILVDWPALDYVEPPFTSATSQVALTAANVPEAQFEYVPWPTAIEGVLPHCSNWDPFIGEGVGFRRDLENDTNKLYRLMVFCNNIGFDVELALLTQYGIEGENWELDENGKVKRLPGTETAEELQKANLMYYSHLITTPTLLVAGLVGDADFNAYRDNLYSTVYGADKIRLLPSTKKDACIDPATNENLDTKYADIFTRRDELFCNIIIGEEPPTAFQEYVTWAYDEMDLATYEALVNEQNIKYWQ